MSYAFFLSERYLKNNTPMGDNVDVKDIYPFAKTAEDTYIQEALGTCLYDRLIESLLASPPDTTADETILLKKVRDALVWYCCYDALPFVSFKIRNIGLQKQSGGPEAEKASLSDMVYLRKELKNKGDFYLKRLHDYLVCNRALFPEYSCSCASCSAGLTPTSDVGPSCALAFDRNSNNQNEYRDFYRKWIL